MNQGDVVLVLDKELSQTAWPLGRIVKTSPSDGGLVRKVIVRIIVDDEPKTYVRPVHEVVVLLQE